MSAGGVTDWEAVTGGCSERLVRFRLRELWQQALNHPGQGTKSEILAWGSRARFGPVCEQGPGHVGDRQWPLGLDFVLQGQSCLAWH